MANEANKIIYSMIKVSKKYNDQVVIKDISLSYFYGAKIGVLGLNGSGKSSLLRILAGIDTEFEGETILSEGFTVDMLEQEPQIDPDKTVREIVEQGAQETVDLIDEYNKINERFAQSAAKYGIAKRIPLSLFQNMLPMRDRIIVLLEHLDYLCRLHREQSGFGRAAYTLSRIPGEETLSVKFISSLEGIDAASIQIIREYLSTGSCRRYSSLL